MKKEWNNIKGYEGLYWVSNFGDVRNKRGNILSLKDNGTGYFQVQLSKNGKKRLLLIHRIVAISFIKNPLKKSRVNHIDNNPKNNKVENLEWVTDLENFRHQINQGRFVYFKRNAKK